MLVYRRYLRGHSAMQMLFARRHGAQGLAEYGLILAIVAVVSIAGLLLFGGVVSQMIATLAQTISANVSP
jgi:Flp pilus assembly pilin Flp